MTPLLDRIAGDPSAVRRLSLGEMEALCAEIRAEILRTVSVTGGHLSSNLGVVELSVALHHTFSFPPDAIVWDVGHQCYPHKLLTGRAGRFPTLRTAGGLSGYPDPAESPADLFRTGHAGTAVSSATGLLLGREARGETGAVVAVIGDGSLTNGLTLEGLNHLGSIRRPLLVVLNDNTMSISPTKGALSYYLTRLVTSPVVNRPKSEFLEILRKTHLGEELARMASDIEKKAKYLVVPGVFFEKLGLRYLGPIGGHDLRRMTEILGNLRKIREPVLLHVLTRKGRGYRPAEENPSRFHGTAPFVVETGTAVPSGKPPSAGVRAGAVLEAAAEKRPDVVVLTAAMEMGLGLESFAERFPGRFLDVGIAEGHCVTLAAGLARAGMRPVVGIYSTFLQRAFDQIVHDAALQNLPVVFLIDRAGLVGDDGPTHHGAFDLSYCRPVPGLSVYAPYSLETLEKRLSEALDAAGPVAIRYPRAPLPERLEASSGPAAGPLALVGTGSMGETALAAAALLRAEGLPAAAFATDAVKPLDEALMERIAASFAAVVAVEENVLSGGFGSAVVERMQTSARRPPVLSLGLPDRFVPHGGREALLAECGLSPAAVAARARSFAAP